MVYAYLRFSTTHQDEIQQMQAINEYATQKGITIDEFEKDEGVSGGVSFRNRNLNRLVKKFKSGDVLLVSEISRLGRSMADINILVNEELKKRGVRLIVIKMGLDLDCANLKAVDQMVLFALSFAAECEKELIKSRTQSALDARKEWLKKDGGFVSKTGNFCDHLGRRKGDKNPSAVQAMNNKKTETASEWRMRSPLYLLVRNMLDQGKSRKDILKTTDALYEKDPIAYGTRTGKPLSDGILSLWAAETTIRN